VGIGSHGRARYPITDPIYGRSHVDLQVEIDETSLRRIAEMTGGNYHRSTDRPSLQGIFEEIGRLEKTKMEVKAYTLYKERFPDFLLPAVMIVAFGTLAGITRFSTLP
jgi:Ca-activated chloride channel homolog